MFLTRVDLSRAKFAYFGPDQSLSEETTVSFGGEIRLAAQALLHLHFVIDTHATPKVVNHGRSFQPTFLTYSFKNNIESDHSKIIYRMTILLLFYQILSVFDCGMHDYISHILRTKTLIIIQVTGVKILPFL